MSRATLCWLALTAFVVAPASADRLFNVGQPLNNLNYAWNPFVNAMQWAANTKMVIGDTLVFNYPAFYDEIWAFPTQQDLESCNYARAQRLCDDQMGAAGCMVKLTKMGTVFLASGMVGFCKKSLRMAVNVQSNYVPRKVVVGAPNGAYKWPWNPAVDFTQWGANNPVYIGDSLVFKYPDYADDVYVVATKQEFDACDYNNYIAFCKANGGGGDGCVTAPLDGAPRFFLSGNFPNCVAGQKFVVQAVPPPN